MAARAIPGLFGPRFPPELKSRDVTGAVVVQFIIDSTGGVERRSIGVVAAGHPEFARSVTAFLATARYAPAKRAGRPVRVWARQRFEFRLECWRSTPNPELPPCSRAHPLPPP
jgi:TonB family protein